MPPGELQAEKLVFSCQGGLAKQNHLNEIEFVADLPETPSGEMMRGIFREADYQKERKKATKLTQ